MLEHDIGVAGTQISALASDESENTAGFRPPPGLSLPSNTDVSAADHAAGRAARSSHLTAAAPTFLPGEAAQWLGEEVAAGDGESPEDAPPAAVVPSSGSDDAGHGAGHSAGRGGGGASAHLDAASQLPDSHRSLLRGCSQDARSGESVPYYVGRLKSFGQKNGYGFLECSTTHSKWGADVFIHKKLLPQSWTLGQFVEFAVVVNERGKPQAADVRWLPPVESTAAGTASIESGASAGGGATSISSPRTGVARAHGDADRFLAGGGSRTASEHSAHGTWTGPQLEEGDSMACLEDMRYLGTLKSFSPAQGYGFIACTELQPRFSRDIYFERSQMPLTRWVVGQTVEFAVALNARGQPQARRLDWDPVPTLPPPGSSPLRPQDHEARALEWLGQLLREINTGEAAAAVVRAVDFQRQAGEDAGTAAAVDFVTFVLDRLPSPEAVARGVAGSVQLLLLLHVSRILQRPDRRRLVSWFDALARCIDPFAAGSHLHQTVSEIARHGTAAMSHMRSQEPAAYEMFHLAVQLLQFKCRQVMLQGGKHS